MFERPMLILMVIGVMALLFVVERLVPLRRTAAPLLRRLLVNATIAALAYATAGLLVRPSATATLQWSMDRSFGAIHLVPLPPAGRFVLAFLLLDLTFYWWHVANHHVRFLWRFHNVHHIDPDLDISTAFRFHVGEVALSTIFRVAQVAVIGPSAAMFAAYELVFQVTTAFHHSNVRLPIGFERALNLVLVTPRMHGIHHSQVRAETNSNYSVVFSWWDRLHRTIGLNIPQAAIVVGVPAYSDPADHTLANDLLLPFRPQRDYWHRPDGSVVVRDAASLPVDGRLAE